MSAPSADLAKTSAKRNVTKRAKATGDKDAGSRLLHRRLKGQLALFSTAGVDLEAVAAATGAVSESNLRRYLKGSGRSLPDWHRQLNRWLQTGSRSDPSVLLLFRDPSFQKQILQLYRRSISERTGFEEDVVVKRVAGDVGKTERSVALRFARWRKAPRRHPLAPELIHAMLFILVSFLDWAGEL